MYARKALYWLSIDYFNYIIFYVGYITTNMLGSSGYISDSGSVTKVDMQGNVYSGDGVSFNIPTN